jgi:hypothetical protein
MASTTKHTGKTAKTKTARAKRAATRGPGRGFGHGGPGHGPVHAEEVVLDKAGTAFITETEDSGKVKSTSGSDVTITEGTGTVTYKDVTVTIPDGATIMRNGKTAAVADLKAGDFIHVSRSSDGAFVFAADSSFRPPMGGGDRDGDHRGFGPPPGAAGPPPGAPAPGAY